MKYRAPSITVHGVETEYSCMVTLPGDIVHEIVGSCHSVDSKLGLYVEPKLKGGTVSVPVTALTDGLESQGIQTNLSGMLTNGGRFYIDPSGPEYASPETSTAEEAVHRTFDGDEIVLGIFEHMRKAGHVEGYQLNRRVVDHNRTSRGIHLNTSTCIDPDRDLTTYEELALATANVAKGAIFGSGGLLVNEEGITEYHHSPRLSVTSDIAAHSHQSRKRPLVRYPFKPDGQFARVETVTADALNLAWPLRASLVVTNAVIKMIENEIRLPILMDPVSAAREVGHRGYDSTVSLQKNGTTIDVKPLDIIRQICEAAISEHEYEEFLDEESVQVLGEVVDVADKMTADPMSVADQVESVARELAMYKKMEKDDIALGSERMCRFDYAWDWIGGGIAETLRKKNAVGWQGFSRSYSRQDTKKRLSNPPTDTRAKLRGDAIAASSNPEDNLSHWGEIDFNDIIIGATISVGALETVKPDYGVGN